MTYSTLMVHLDGGRPNAPVLDTAAAIAAQFGSRVIGIAACQPCRIEGSDAYLNGSVAVMERDVVTEELARTKVEFHAHPALHHHVLEWRSIPTLADIARVVAEQARCADLIVTGVGTASDGPATHADTGALILRAGRPVLVVPDAGATADFARVVVAWADTRECRRAVMDALPILHRADRVIVIEASTDPVAARRGIDDVRDWLGRHGIGADLILTRVRGVAADTLATIASEVDADLIVAGAYGHGRIREWAFGGVTRDLLLSDRRCTFLSH